MVGWSAGRGGGDLHRRRPGRDLGGLDTRNGKEIEGKGHPNVQPAVVDRGALLRRFCSFETFHCFSQSYADVSGS